MEIKQLAYFVQVADSGGFSRAALALNIAQSTLSRQVGLLESEHRHRLLRRTGHGAELTDAGALLLPLAREIVARAHEAQARLRDHEAVPSGKVTIGVPPAASVSIAVPLVRQFRAAFPKATLSMVEAASAQMREWVIEGQLDLALLNNPQPSPSLQITPLKSEDMVLVGPASRPALPERVALASLPDFPMIQSNALAASLEQLAALLAPLPHNLEIVAEAANLHAVLELVGAGMGYTVVPQSMVSQRQPDKRLQIAAIGPPAIKNRLCLATPLGRPDSRLARQATSIVRSIYRRSAA